MRLIHANTAAYMINYTKEFVQMRISNDKSFITSTRIFHKMAVLHCISISELCSTVHEKFISQH